MNFHFRACLAFVCAAMLLAGCGTKTESATAERAAPGASTLVETVGTTGFLQLEADSFGKLTPREQTLAYWLSQASVAIDPIIYDQLSRYGLREKRLLEALVAHPQGTKPEVMAKIVGFTKLFWGNKGNHNETTAQKFLPEFTFEELQEAGTQAIRSGLRIGDPYGTGKAIATEAEFVAEITGLRPALFDPNFEPTITAKSPQGGLDILQASANNFYLGVRLADLKGFRERYPLNSRLVRTDGKLVEQVYRAGTPDGRIPPGLYAQFLNKANENFQKARAYAEPGQETVIDDLIRFYQTGEPEDWLRFGASWVQNNADVDFANGFIEVYRDARGAKGTSQSFVSVTDQRVNPLMVKIADNAQYFEDRAPWDAEVQEAGREAAHGQGRGDRDRDRRFPRDHRRRQPAQRERNPREVRHEELSVHGQARARFRTPQGYSIARGVCVYAGGDRARQEVRRRSRRPDDGAARDHRPRLGQAESQAHARCGVLSEGILLPRWRKPART